MNRICPRCQRVYSYEQGECPKGCNAKRKKETNRMYDKYQRKNHDFYNSKEWKVLREACKNKFSGLCIWSLYKHKRMIKGTTAHHIKPVELNKEDALKLSNLIFVCDEAHREIHKEYSKITYEEYMLLDDDAKIKVNKKIREKLYRYVRRFVENDEGWGT